MKPCLLQKLILILLQFMLEGWVGGGGGEGILSSLTYSKIGRHFENMTL